MTLSEILKSLVFLLVAVQFVPTIFKNVKSQYSNIAEHKTKVGIIPLTGAIADSEKCIKNLKKYFEDKDIKAIVLKMDSPGGASGASQDIFQEILALKKVNNKKIITFVQNMAASGGYYIATATDYIIATPSSFIGSIGSYIAFPTVKNFIEQFKLKYEIIKSGDFKTAANPFTELTPEQRQMFQELSDNVYHQFINDVAAQRKSLPTDYKLWAEGKIFTGEQAFKIGLIDEIGSHSSVIQALKAQAGIEGKIEWVKEKSKTNALYSLLSGDDDDKESEFNTLISKIYNALEKHYMHQQAQAQF